MFGVRITGPGRCAFGAGLVLQQKLLRNARLSFAASTLLVGRRTQHKTFSFH